MSSRRFVPVFPATVWFWLILFACIGLATSFSCYECFGEDACKKAEKKACPVPPQGSAQKNYCIAVYVEGKAAAKSCGFHENPKDTCEKKTEGGKEGYGCSCVKDACNTGTKPPTWNNLLWVGLASFYAILH